MPAKLRAFVAVAIVALLAVGVYLWRRGPALKTPLTPEMQKAFGAAAYVPEDVSAYAAHMDLGPSLRAVWNSQAVQSLVALPLVQQFWMQVQQSPPYREFARASKTQPALVEGLPILDDAVSSEVFACAGPEFPEFLGAAGAVFNTIQLAGFRRGMAGVNPDAEPPTAAILDIIVANEKRLQVPSLLLGFKLTRPDAARDFLDSWIPKIGPTPFGEFARKSRGAGALHVLELHGETMFRGPIVMLPRDLERQGVPDGVARRFVNWLAGFRITIAVGVFGDYLLVSIGRDTALLDQWGRGRSLAETPDLDPLRASFKPGLQSLSYSSAKMDATLSPTPADLRRFATVLADVVPQRPATKGLRERILKDAEELIRDIDFPAPSAALACSFANKGVETLSFGGQPLGGLDHSQPLTILAHRTKQPIVYSASRAAKTPPGSYDKAVKWIKILFGYFEDYGVPNMPPDARKHYGTIMAFVRPFLAEVDDATRTCLVPALDGVQTLFVLDGQGALSSFPNGTSPPKTIPLPRFAVAVELTDPQKFTQGIERYAAAVQRLLDDARKAYPKHIPPHLTLPAPVVADTAAGKQVYYPIPWNLGPDVFPCAVLKGRLLILASSSNLAREMTEAVPMPTSPVTAPDKAAGAVAGANLLRAWNYTSRLSDALFALIQADGTMRQEDRQQAMLVKMHLDALWRSLGALSGYSSTTTLRDGRVVTHSWLHVEDIKP
ncbi:MAG TPA: hypothetical protein VNE39_06020 [Planctomycetota bacterium]|nr:hypothetical protein [Planctomycetota bacterium]